MIHFSKLRWKNFLSTGDTFIEILFDKNPTTLIIGENGSGKSTMLDALCFSLFGKPFRTIKKQQLINSINERGTVVEVEFNIGRKNFLVRRGIKPNIFDIHVDNEILEQNANVRDFQEFLEKHVLKLNYKSFTQIVVLGSSSFVPFMQLKTFDRRSIIEDLLDITIFSSMNQVLKNYAVETRDDLQVNYTDVGLVENKIELKKDYIEQLKNKTNQIVEQNKKEVLKNEEQKKSLRSEIDKLNKEVEQLLKQIEDLPEVEKNRVKLDKYSSSIEHKCSQEEKHVSFYGENDDCPTCKQHINDEFKQQAIQEHEEEIEKYKQALDEIGRQHNKLQQRHSDIQQLQTQVNDLQSQSQKKFSSLDAIEQYITKIEKDIEDIQTDQLSLQEKREELIERQATQDVAKHILQDTGIKTIIVKQYLPIMNKLINKYLADMNFFASFNLDENFNEDIRSRYRDDFSYANFSEGEKSRIDLSLLFTWRAVAKLKNSTNTNILIMDEVFDSSLDGDGVENLMKILNRLDKKTNIFIISHKGDQLFDKFTSVIKFEKRKNFSEIASNDSINS
jgi:DNA repair exonuclease SbcCD ATPase subunit